MTENKKPDTQPVNQVQVPQQPKRPNEVGSISITGFVKIYDPNTQEVFTEKRT